MLKGNKAVWLRMALAGALAVGGAIGTASAQKQGVTQPQDRVAIGEDDAKRLLMLMDTDQNGKVSKKEFMAFMEAEFKRLDKDKNGYLDVKELTQSTFKINQPSSSVGK